MKNFFSKFLIVILILGFFLAPATPKIDTQNHFSLVKNEAKAEKTFQSIKGRGSYTVTSSSATSSSGTVTGTTEGYPDGTYTGKFWIFSIGDNASYTITVKDNKIVAGTWTAPGEVKTGDSWVGNYYYNTPIIDTGGLAGNGVVAGPTNYEDDYGCGITTIFTACLIKGIYTIFFNLFAYLARLSAKILDYFAFYSISSIAYQDKSFIDNGWTVVRDLGNLFFIVALLYIAGKTVLGLNGSDNKKVVTMVVVMALLINFSLFITKIVIDSSNILARVFYASIESKTENGTPLPPDYDGEKSITIGLVKTFNPQDIFINNKIEIKDNLGSFAIVLIISIILMIYLMYIFLSISFVFVGRVAMLWILMIFSPIAFASLTMPGVRIPGFGFKEWWSQLFNQAFLAPIFVFFLYLIISFGDALKFVDSTSDVLGGANLANVGATTSYDTLNLFMKVFVPFMILFVLLKQAKEITIKMAGKLGEGMSTVGTWAATAAFGSSLAGVAVLGRQAIGGTMARASKEETLSQRYAKGDTSKMNRAQKLFGWAGASIGLNKLYGKNEGIYDVKTRQALGVTTGLGGLVNNSQRKINEINHGKHELESAMKNAHFEGRTMKSLSFAEKQTLMKEFTKIKKSEIENDIKDGKVKGVPSRSEYEKDNGKIITANMLSPVNISKTVADGDAEEIIDSKTKKGTGTYRLTDQGKKNVESEINTNYTKIIKENTEKQAETKFNHVVEEAGTKVSLLEKSSAKSTSSNYDLRDFKPELKGLNATSKASLFVLGLIASNIRSGLKKANIDPGKGAGDITKDLTNTISTAIAGIGKSMKVDIGGGGGHGGGGHDDHGGGHDDHGHGGGGHGH